MVVAPDTWKDLGISVHGVYSGGYIGPVPADLSMELSLNQPRQFDPVVERIKDLAADAVYAKLSKEEFLQSGELVNNLGDALYAVRYHQRQFLVRLRIVSQHYAAVRGTGSDQIDLIFHDQPLKFEAEALVTRYRTALDAAAHALAVALGRKPQKFGELAQWLSRRRDGDLVLGTLRGILERHKEWVDRVSSYRHDIAHKSRFSEYSGIRFGVHGVRAARVAEYDAADFATSVWGQLVEFVRELFAALRQPTAQRDC